MMLSVRILKMKLVNQFISILSAAILTAASASTLLAELPDPDGKPADMGTVSYTHLTLPTILRV